MICYMRLEDLYVDEELTLLVYDFETGKLIAKYDGRDSIPEEYNECLVKDLDFTCEDAIKAYIKL